MEPQKSNGIKRFRPEDDLQDGQKSPVLDLSTRIFLIQKLKIYVDKSEKFCQMTVKKF